MAQLHKSLGNFPKAIEHLEAYDVIQKDIFNDESDRRLRSLQVIHQTRLAQQEAEIQQQHNLALQHEIAERQRAELALQAANKQLQQQNEELDAYAHMVAHDLKQPLSVVTMLVDMLTEDRDHLSRSQFIRKLHQMRQASRRAHPYRA